MKRRHKLKAARAKCKNLCNGCHQKAFKKYCEGAQKYLHFVSGHRATPTDFGNRPYKRPYII